MTHKQKILAILADGREHASIELHHIGKNGGFATDARSRISDLINKDGYNIVTRQKGTACWYRLVSAPASGFRFTLPPLESTNPVRARAGRGKVVSVCASGNATAVLEREEQGRLL